MSGSKRDSFSPVAGTVPFDNAANGFVADEVQGAIEELAEAASSGASPGFSFGRSGNTPSNAYLLNEGVPSNTTGRPVYLTNGHITQLSVANEIVSTFSIQLEEHDGTTFTTLGTFSVTALRSQKFSGLNIAITSGKELAVKVASGSCKNPIVTVYVKGDAV